MPHSKSFVWLRVLQDADGDSAFAVDCCKVHNNEQEDAEEDLNM